MSSSTQICNIALSKVGGDSILDLSEDSRSGRICNLVYNDMRQAVLRGHNWNFAIERVELAQLVAIPAFGFSYQYQLPSDFLKLVGTSYDDYNTVKHRIESDKLLTNEQTFSIKYIKDVTNEALFDAMFREVLSTRIAAEIAIFLTDDEPLHDRMMAEYEFKIGEARSVSSQENTPEGLTASTWINSRI